MRTRISDARLSALAALPLFRACSKQELASIDALVDEIEVEAGEVLTREGHPGRESFIIVDGEAAVTLRDRGVARLGPGEFFGEMAVLAPNRPRSATVTAATPMRILVLDPRSLFALAAIPTVSHKLLVGLIDRLRTTEGAPAYS